MRIWLINPYGTIPGEAWRDYRYTTFGRSLAALGHDVTWWTSNFSHHFKKYRSRSLLDLDVCKNFKIRLVPTTRYTRNVSIARVFRDMVFAYRTFERGKMEVRPDLIISSEPPFNVGFAGIRLGGFHNSPVVVDQIDLWPELFVSALSPALNVAVRPIVRLLVAFRRMEYARAYGIIALAKPYLEAAGKGVDRVESKVKAVIYNGVDVDEIRQKMTNGSDSHGIGGLPKKGADRWGIFAGSLGPTYDIEVLLRAAPIIADSVGRFRLIVAGDGPLRETVERASVSRPDCVTFLGRLSHSDLCRVYAKSEVAIAAYGANTNVEMPDKFYDYTAAGLPIICSLRGEVAQIIRENGCGDSYKGGEVASLVECTKALLQDEARRMKMASASWAIGTWYDRGHQLGTLRKVVAGAPIPKGLLYV